MRQTFLRNIAKDSAEMERIVMASDLDWTIARPPRLTNGPLTGRYGTADDRMPPGARGAAASISRADVAHFLLEELEHRAHVRRIVGMAYTRASARGEITTASYPPSRAVENESGESGTHP
jgi:putative NADH-flavin reductase